MTGFITTAVTGVFLLQTVTPSALALGEASVRDTPSEPTYPTHVVSMTAYNAVPEQTDSNPFVTAIGAYTDTDIVAARSVDLADELPWGTVIEVVPADDATKDRNCGRSLVQDQIGLRVISDSMHPRKRMQIDILLDQTKTISLGGKKLNPAKVLGRCKNVEIRVVGRIDTKKMPKTQNELKLALETRNLAAEDHLAINQ